MDQRCEEVRPALPERGVHRVAVGGVDGDGLARRGPVLAAPVTGRSNGATAAVVICVSTIGVDAREISASCGDSSRCTGFDCAAAAVTRAVATATAHRTGKRAEGDRPARSGRREWRVGMGSKSREAMKSKVPPTPKTGLRRP